MRIVCIFVQIIFYISYIYFPACGASKKTPVADLRLFLAPPAEWIPDVTDSSGKDDEDTDKLRSTKNQRITNFVLMSQST